MPEIFSNTDPQNDRIGAMLKIGYRIQTIDSFIYTRFIILLPVIYEEILNNSLLKVLPANPERIR